MRKQARKQARHKRISERKTMMTTAIMMQMHTMMRICFCCVGEVDDGPAQRPHTPVWHCSGAVPPSSPPPHRAAPHNGVQHIHTRAYRHVVLRRRHVHLNAVNHLPCTTLALYETTHLPTYLGSQSAAPCPGTSRAAPVLTISVCCIKYTGNVPLYFAAASGSPRAGP
jgi:hypothetical protein